MSQPAASAPQPPGLPVESRKPWVVPRWLKEAFVGVAAVALISLGVAKFFQLYGSRFERAKNAMQAQDVEGPARNIVLPRRGGGTYDLADSRGKIVLVNFWATWCAPCRDEMPSLAKLSQAMDPATFQLVAVSVDETWAPIEGFFEGKPTPYPVVLDPKGERFSMPYGTTKFPETYLLDRQGNLKLKFVGPRSWNEENVIALLEQVGAKRVALR